MKKSLSSIISLTVICSVIAIILAAVNYVSLPIIEKNEAAAANEALLIVMPDGEDFAAVDISGYELPSTVNEVYSEKNGGYVVKLTTTGYSSGLVIMCGIDKNGTVTGATCIASTETLGYEATYGEEVKNKTLEDVDSAVIVAGATKTTEAYRNAVKDALRTAVVLGGGEVDIRDEAQILADNLAAALPSGDSFEPRFITEPVESVSAAYSAKNGAGTVYVVDEEFVGVDASGNVVSKVSDAAKAAATAANQKLSVSTLEKIDLSKYSDMPSHVVEAYQTSGGSYVFELKAAGFGINGDHYYNPSGEHIKIKVSVSAEGKIIATETIYQKETDGIGSACADSSFYSQFNGKDETNYSEIDAISGATITTNGYKTAISKVFEALKILKGAA